MMSQARSTASHQYLSSRRLFNVFSGAPVHHWRFRSSRKTPAARFHEVLPLPVPSVGRILSRRASASRHP